MKKLLIILICLCLFMGCASWYENWALDHGYIHKDDIPDPDTILKRQPLPHPILPILDIDTLTFESLMEQVLLLDAAIQKYLILTEIYEREYCELPDGYSNAKYSNKTLEELKLEYYKLLGILKEIEPVIE